jgi:hypothetical protein
MIFVHRVRSVPDDLGRWSPAFSLPLESSL